MVALSIVVLLINKDSFAGFGYTCFRYRMKPTLVGGFGGSQEWINLATSNSIGWWVTSALESNIGLNAIAQWTYGLKSPLPQGLGTGGLFNNNIQAPLMVNSGQLFYDLKTTWNLKF